MDVDSVGRNVHGSISPGDYDVNTAPLQRFSYKGGARLSSVQLCTISPASVLAV